MHGKLGVGKGRRMGGKMGEKWVKRACIVAKKCLSDDDEKCSKRQRRQRRILWGK